jgi:hypothetical protein
VVNRTPTIHGVYLGERQRGAPLNLLVGRLLSKDRYDRSGSERPFDSPSTGRSRSSSVRLALLILTVCFGEILAARAASSSTDNGR